MTILVSGLLGILCAVGLYPDDARGQDVILGGVRPRIILEKPAVPAAVVAPQSSGEKPELPPVDPTGFEARLNDDSRLKLSLADETIEVTGRYGTLRIPASEVLRIEFATRINPETRQQIEKALAELGSPEEQVRGNAALQLGRLRHLAYPAIAQAAKDSQSPAGQQAAMLIAKYYGTVSEKDFAPRETDMIYTVDDAIAGMIVAPSLKVRTAQFGELTLKVADARSLRLQSLPAEDAESDTLGQVLTDPGNLASFYANPGQVLRFRLVGEVGREIWGTDVYTADSALSSAAVHAGVLQAGSTGVVKVKIVDPPAHFRGSSRNGARSNSYGAYPKAYQFVK
jgi:hypothetical protein